MEGQLPMWKNKKKSSNFPTSIPLFNLFIVKSSGMIFTSHEIAIIMHGIIVCHRQRKELLLVVRLPKSSS